MIELQPAKHLDRLGSTAWQSAPAFFVNPRGILTHRVRFVSTHYDRDRKVSHYSVRFWCGNGTCFHDGECLVEDPPKERLLCSFCEAKAIVGQQATADKLAGRHVHRGILKAHRVCCRSGDTN